jgi:hypothetical protein
MQRLSMLHVPRVPASATYLRPHVEQNSQEFVAAICCSFLALSLHSWRMTRTVKSYVDATSQCRSLQHPAACPWAASENGAECGHALRALCRPRAWAGGCGCAQNCAQPQRPGPSRRSGPGARWAGGGPAAPAWCAEPRTAPGRKATGLPQQKRSVQNVWPMCSPRIGRAGAWLCCGHVQTYRSHDSWASEAALHAIFANGTPTDNAV